MKKFLIGFIIGLVSSWILCESVQKSKNKDVLQSCYIDLSCVESSEIEKEYFRLFSPAQTLDFLLHKYSMTGTIYEDTWELMSDSDKICVFLEEVYKDERP